MPPPKKLIPDGTFLYQYAWEELSNETKELINMAKKASYEAYAPYSGFNVGAALLLEDGQKLKANNQENVSFPVGVCAERILLGYAHANFPKVVPRKLAIAAHRSGEKNKQAMVSPCGLCRQTINEYENIFGSAIEIFMLAPNDQVFHAEGIAALLPFKFDDLTS